MTALFSAAPTPEAAPRRGTADVTFRPSPQPTPTDHLNEEQDS